jgi:hypothetical protein
MGIELTQWTLVKPGRLGAPSLAAPDSIWLKAPSGEMQLVRLPSLSTEVRSFVAELASGSKVPKEILGDILAARGADATVTGQSPIERPWTFHHIDTDDGLYVFLNPPPERRARPVSFSLVGLAPLLRRQLELSSPGDPVADDVIAALQGTAPSSLADVRVASVSDRAPR